MKKRNGKMMEYLNFECPGCGGRLKLKEAHGTETESGEERFALFFGCEKCGGNVNFMGNRNFIKGFLCEKSEEKGEK